MSTRDEYEPGPATGAEVEKRDDAWTLIASPAAACVQYEHTLVATRKGAIVVTLN